MNGGAEQVSYYHTDHLGSIRAVSNTDASTMTYDAFGKLLDYAGAAQDHDYRFTSKPSDSTGLSYYGARFYDPELAGSLTKTRRWMARIGMCIVETTR